MVKIHPVGLREGPSVPCYFFYFLALFILVFRTVSSSLSRATPETLAKLALSRPLLPPEGAT